MESTQLYAKDFCTIYHVHDKNFINIQWNGFPRSEDFREACMKVIDFMNQCKTGKLLTDNRNAKVFSVKDQNWLNTEWLEKAIDAGYCCSATLINDDVFIKTAIKNITTKRNRAQVKTKIFITENEAIDWLINI